MKKKKNKKKKKKKKKNVYLTKHMHEHSVMSGDSQKDLCKPLAGSHPSSRKVN